MKRFHFKLYIAGTAPNSIVAQNNLSRLCEKHFANDFEIEVIDVIENPRRALSDRVFVTPTLIKVAPLPSLQLVGNLGDQEKLLQLLNSKQPCPSNQPKT